MTNEINKNILKEEYKTILDEYSNEIEIKKSRFIASIKRCNSEEESIKFIEKIKNKYNDATHNCSAYINGPKKNTQRYNDDGEPQGTAGIPMLEVLKKEDLTNLCVVVTRYYGGKKLGASGLIRAYGGSVTDVLEKSEVVELKNFYKIKMNFDYTFLGKIDNYFETEDVFVKSRDYLEKIENILYIDVKRFEKIKSDMLNITSGDIEIKNLDTILLQVKNKEIIE